jgi:uncharacterized protein YdiU (UPF0061 family)
VDRVFQAVSLPLLKKQGVSDAERWEIQREANPVLVPRNHIMVGIIDEVERGEFSGLRRT